MDICTHCRAYNYPIPIGDKKYCGNCNGLVAQYVNGKWERIILPD